MEQDPGVNPLLFPLLRVLSEGGFQSGEALAERFGVTRATVSNALRDVERLDVRLTRVPGKGYRLDTPLDWLDRDAVVAAAGRPVDLELHDALNSTSSVLMREAQAGAPHGRVVAAEFQTGGRGRRGREWHAGLGGALTFSLLWRFDLALSALAGLSLAAGVAVRRALSEAGVAGIELKWPNDVVHRYHKLAGVLIELSGEALGPAAAIIGIGVNLRLSGATRERIDQAATDLATVGGPMPARSVLLGRMLAHLADALTVFEREGFGVLRPEWETAHAHQGRQVRVLGSGVPERSGIAVGVGDDGALLLETPEGRLRILSGEVTLRAI